MSVGTTPGLSCEFRKSQNEIEITAAPNATSCGGVGMSATHHHSSGLKIVSGKDWIPYFFYICQGVNRQWMQISLQCIYPSAPRVWDTSLHLSCGSGGFRAVLIGSRPALTLPERERKLALWPLPLMWIYVSSCRQSRSKDAFGPGLTKVAKREEKPPAVIIIPLAHLYLSTNWDRRSGGPFLCSQFIKKTWNSRI